MNRARELHNLAMAYYDQAHCCERAAEYVWALEHMRHAADAEQAAYDATPEGAEPSRAILRDSVEAMRENVARLEKEVRS